MFLRLFGARCRDESGSIATQYAAMLAIFAVAFVSPITQVKYGIEETYRSAFNGDVVVYANASARPESDESRGQGQSKGGQGKGSQQVAGGGSNTTITGTEHTIDDCRFDGTCPDEPQQDYGSGSGEIQPPMPPEPAGGSSLVYF